VDPDFVFIVTYACPRCHASLEARASGPPTWLRCPACGRACLPPEHNRISHLPSIDDDMLIIGNFTTAGGTAPLPLRPRAMAPLPLRQPAPSTPTARLLLGTGFFLTTIMFVFSLLDADKSRAGFFGFIAVICLVLLARRTGRPSRD
jgi:hypothetical protein